MNATCLSAAAPTRRVQALLHGGGREAMVYDGSVVVQEVDGLHRGLQGSSSCRCTHNTQREATETHTHTHTHISRLPGDLRTFSTTFSKNQLKNETFMKWMYVCCRLNLFDPPPAPEFECF